MPTVSFRDREIECEEGDILRDVILEAGETPHNGRAEKFNCRGIGSCGTCAVSVVGEVSEPNKREHARLKVPPHTPESGLRLACQTKVLGDVSVVKHMGFCGQSVTGPEDDPIEE